ncbi:acyl-CoA thioester hydrolase/BAAT C-terminal domain-containing protein [Niallia sp. 01092]|uniref:acyl-CoA thioester hydrolase/BAAT C-terminal domain-containing protein n=1 Tax=unclassified Niallia TaxID=2837522 RepID=UPI003FD54399
MKTKQLDIIFSKDQSFADERINIKVIGLLPNQKIKIEASTDNYQCINIPIQHSYGVWNSYGYFIANDEGVVDLSKQIPIDGSYNYCDSMGLFSSMSQYEVNKNLNIPTKLDSINVFESYSVTFTLTIDNEVVCQKPCLRLFKDSNVKVTTIDNENLTGRLFINTSLNEIKPCIIVLSGSDGRIEKAQMIASLLASHGFHTLALSYFGLDGLSENLSEIPIEYIENAISFLQSHPKTQGNQIYLYGRSKGGEMALLAGTLFPQIKKIVANTPSCYVYEGISKNKKMSRHSSWTFKGSEIPYARISMKALCSFLLKKLLSWKTVNLIDLYDFVLKDKKNLKASIPLEKINGDILFLSSVDDEIWPSFKHCNIAEKYLDKYNFIHRYEHFSYQDCGHFLTIPFQAYRPNRKNNIQGFNQSCEDSWIKTLNHFNSKFDN